MVIKLENRKLVLVPEEAEIVRLIYKLYLEGYGDMPNWLRF